MSEVRVLVLLSTYNGEAYLEQQLNSLLEQAGVDLHILVRDDGSSDSTATILKDYQERYPDKLSLIFGENVGLPHSYFELIKHAGSDMSNCYPYFAFCDQDDVWLPDKLQRATVSLQSEKDSGAPLMYCSSTQMVDCQLNKLGIWPTYPAKKLSLYNALVENVAVGCTTVLNRVALMQIAAHVPQNPNRVIMHDWWAYLWVSALGRVIFDKHPAILYRQHGGNTLGGQHEKSLAKWVKRLWRFFRGSNHFILSNQARQFYHCFGHLIDEETRQEVLDFLRAAEGSLLYRAKYILRLPLYRQRPADQLVLGLMILLRRI
ncbi:glycosyl transferase family 2 [Paenibacillus antibioticophila]|uniref:Glycosyl transferase family 2 n=1 Tax=Paenibacillus antibioticophila TaxID=1274374 RepID=A0A919XR06_9BACL|nr:glycosyltransferase family 2 protein [Paenibacillus antibioticophila]GIO35152.1 glycosyl transferase family 2 [Paenibacillus antibioticophila]